jgi:hypothetical protein
MFLPHPWIVQVVRYPVASATISKVVATSEKVVSGRPEMPGGEQDLTMAIPVVERLGDLE